MTVETSCDETTALFFPDELEVGAGPFVEQDVHRGTLHIRGVQEVDAGQYSCVASSSAGTTAGTVSLEVGGELAVCAPKAQTALKIYRNGNFRLLFAVGPLFSEAPVDVTVNIGENVTLPCSARGFPQTTVTWHRQDGRQILRRTDSHSRTMQLENGHLLIHGELSMKHYHSRQLWCSVQDN